MRIAEWREEQPYWVVRREEVELTEEVLGRGGWGEVKVANFVVSEWLQNSFMTLSSRSITSSCFHEK